MTISTLRARLQTATEADQAEILEDPFEKMVYCDQRFDDALASDLMQDFGMLIKAKAYESAALLIMRAVLPGWGYTLREGRAELRHPEQSRNDQIANGATLPLAIIAAICAAKGDGDA